MRRRLTLSMLAMVVVSLLLSGVVSLALAQHDAVEQTRKELVREASGLATTFRQEAGERADPAVALRNLLVALRGPLRLDGATVLAVRPATGALFDPTAPLTPPKLPSGLALSDLPAGSLESMRTISGHKGSLTYAAAPYQARITIRGTARSVLQVVVVTRTAPSALTSAGAWLALSALVIVAAAALVAHRLGRRFAAPVAAAEVVARRVAEGDLSGRVLLREDADPELRALATSINDMALRLAHAKAGEAHFLQSVSHDLRTPLTSIRGFAEAIEDGAIADPPAAAAVIAAESRRLERLVGDLLALATLQARRFSLHPVPVDLGAEVTTTVTGFLPSATTLGLSLTVEGPPQPALVIADPDRLGQVVANLVENALRYAGSAVLVSVGVEGFTVTDDGPGIDAERLPHVFERLYESRPAPDRPIGSGLGLTIVSELVAAMGGSVSVQSPTGPAGGSRFEVRLPAAR